MQSVEVLRNAPSLSLPNPVDLIARFMPETLIAERVDRPFVERRGTIKWPELARPLPYQQIIGLIDQLITRATIGDRLAYAGDAASTDADRLEALVKERATLEQELTALRGSRSRLAAAYVQALNDKMIRDSREWRLRLQAYLSRWRAASG